MKIYALSDVHIDYPENRDWLNNLSGSAYVNDVLILAGDLSDNLVLLEQCLRRLREKFRWVFYVPGNHELWVIRDKLDNSLEKFHQVCEIATRCDICIQAKSIGQVSIVPLLAWYDFSFGAPSEKLLKTWVDFRACQWPDDYQIADVAQYFLQRNHINLSIKNRRIISFSHFLPRIDLMPTYIPKTFRYIYPVLGCSQLDQQVRTLGSDIHIYGHSHVNNQVTIEGVKYINNAFAYPKETRIARKELLCVAEIPQSH